MKRKFSKHEMEISLALCVSGILVGFAEAYTDYGKPTLLNNSFLPDQDKIKIVNMIIPFMAAISALIGGALIEAYGRQTIIICQNYGFFFSFLIMGEATTLIEVVIGRAICGICIGMSVLAIPLYLLESLNTPCRGMLMMLPIMFSEFGGIFVHTSYLLAMDWNLMAYIGISICGLSLLILIFVPDSPRWYIIHEKDQRTGQYVLAWLRSSLEDAENEFNEITALKNVLVASDSPFFGGIYKLRKAILIVICLMSSQQIFRLNEYTIIPILSIAIHSLLNSIIGFTGSLVCTMFIDRLGRKPLLTFSFYLTFIAIIFSTILVQLNLSILNQFIIVRNINLITLYVFYKLALSIGLKTIPWILMGEISPVKYRSVLCSLAVMSYFIAKIIMNELLLKSDFDYLMVVVVVFIYIIYAIPTIWIIRVYLPETMNLTLEEIEFKIMFPYYQ